MSILTVAAAAAKKIGLDVPSALVGETDRTSIELLERITDSAEFIANGRDWQILRRIHTLTGDGTTTAFNMPSDYSRMLLKAQIWSSSLECPLSPISDSDKWLGLDVQDFDFVVNAWTIYGGQMHIKPALATAVTAKYFYISDLIYQDDDGTTNIGDIAADTDTFRLDEKLLELCVIWRWKASKGQAYAEAMADYEQRLARLVARDMGSRMLRMGALRVAEGITTAYPQAIDP
jgi:hypothetical protein